MSRWRQFWTLLPLIVVGMLASGAPFAVVACTPAQTQQAVEAASPNVARLADGVNEVARAGTKAQAVTVEACNAAEVVAANHPNLQTAISLKAAIRVRCNQAFDAFNRLRLAIEKTDQTVAQFKAGAATLEQAFEVALDAKDAGVAAEKSARELATYLESFK